ncbi:hypothetical protein GKE82_23525 [Conexibacter sp. W3-3-2]|uniref:DNA cytosine methyltransferase n=1 Tax=Conexibacter sp. W3-3-2 TaxID=2675227 RepID=UPI0012B93C31|nr:DNA cytosine methyltransferase [Conexibacter sp. W3-3-2]MTD47176.1 hypothetical protein [Conexibacter sp. W3-3-2]
MTTTTRAPIRAHSAHLFAGAGGDLNAAEMAAVRPLVAANHATDSIRTHRVHGAELWLGDIAISDPRRLDLSQVDILYGSPECDAHSPSRNQREMIRNLGPWNPDRAMQRSRVTMYDPLRFAIAWPNIKACILENVTESATRWRGFRDWVQEWHKAGFTLQAASLNGAFMRYRGLEPSAQARDRVFYVATRKTIPVPDLTITVEGLCLDCDLVVDGVQTWKPAAIRNAGPLGPIGKYGPRGQYQYTCPRCTAPIAPFITAAAQALDWSDLGQVIGDRAKPLAPKTMDRIRRGLEKIRADQLVPLDRLGYPKRTRPVWLAPAFTQTARRDQGLLLPDTLGAAQIALRQNSAPRSITDPAITVAATGNHHALVLSNMANNVPRLAGSEPAGTVTSGNRLALVKPDEAMLVQTGANTYERPGYTRAWSVSEPAKTINGTLDRALVTGPPREPGDGVVVGNYGGKGGGHVTCTLTNPTRTMTAAGQSALARVDDGRLTQADPITDEDVARSRFRMLRPDEIQRLMGLEYRLQPNTDGTFTKVPFVLMGRSNRSNVRMSGNAIVPACEAILTDRVLDAIGH